MGCKTIGTSWYPLRESMFAKRADKTLVSEKKVGFLVSSMSFLALIQQ